MQAERESPSARGEATELTSGQMSGKAALQSIASPTKKVHVVGVAGTGLRGLVHLLHARGVEITGSELLESPVLQNLRGRGIPCHVGHKSVNVDRETSLVLVSAAVKASNPEVKAAHARRIPVLKYAEFLGRLMAEKVGIAVAGTHGKTTTTAMSSLVLREAGLNPSFLIGGEHPALGGSSSWDNGDHFVAEACEFDRSFLNLRPRIGVITNIEEDHLDYFKSLKEIQGAFADFVSLIPEKGYLVVNRDDPNSAYLSEFCRSPVGTFSLRPGAAEWWAEGVTPESGGSRFQIVGQSGERAEVRLRVPGRHNVLNALATAAVSRYVGVPLARIARILGTFGGVRRRFDVLSEHPVMVIDDYAHHPTEIQAVLRAARESLDLFENRRRRVIAVFQPHQHSRLKVFGKRFAEVLSGFDAALVTDVYRARDNDEDVKSVRSDSLVHLMKQLNPGMEALHTPQFADVLRTLGSQVRPGDAVIFLGAGDITNLAARYAQSLVETRALGETRGARAG